jgi:hypothetical protein
MELIHSSYFWSLLPPSNKANAYKAMCFVKYILDKEGNKDFKAETIADRSQGLFSKQLVGRTLGLINCESDVRPERVNGFPNRRRYWNATSVSSVYSTWGITAWSLEECKAINPLDIELKHSKTGLFSGELAGKETSKGDSTTHIESPLLVIFQDYFKRDVEIINSIVPYPFHCYYELIKALKKYLIADDNGCVFVPKEIKTLDKEGYSIVTSKLLKHVGIPYPIEYFSTKKLHRIVLQVYNPFLNYVGIDTHHRCKNRDCISRLCLTPALKSLHDKYHRKDGTYHPMLDEDISLQPVETKTLNKPETPKDNVIPFYKINRSNGVNFNTNLMIDCGNGVVMRANKLPPEQLHNFQEGFNYKGK